MPPWLIQDYPHPEPDTVRNILEGLQGYTPKEQFEQSKREAMDPIKAFHESEVNQQLATHLRHMFNNGPKEPGSKPVNHMPEVYETKDEAEERDARWDRVAQYKLSEKGAVECPAGTSEIFAPTGPDS